MKKLICIMMALSMLFMLASCTDSPGVVPDVEETTSAQASTGTTKPAGTTKPGETTTSPVAEETMPTGTGIEVTTDKDGMPVDSNTEGTIGNIFKSDKYTMKFDIRLEQEGALQTLPVTAYVSGKKVALVTEMDMEGQTLSVKMLSTGPDFYAIIPTLKMYMKLPADDFKDLFPDFANTDDVDVKYKGTTKVTYKGVQYICEAYESEGMITRYYFSGGQLKRIEFTDSDGSTSILENVSFSTKVDESIFDLPKGYVDMSAFGDGLLGG